MENISNILKEALEDIEFNGKKLKYNPETGKYETNDDIKDNSLIMDPDNDVSVKFHHKEISNTVIIDET